MVYSRSINRIRSRVCESEECLSAFDHKSMSFWASGAQNHSNFSSQRGSFVSTVKGKEKLYPVVAPGIEISPITQVSDKGDDIMALVSISKGVPSEPYETVDLAGDRSRSMEDDVRAQDTGSLNEGCRSNQLEVEVNNLKTIGMEVMGINGDIQGELLKVNLTVFNAENISTSVRGEVGQGAQELDATHLPQVGQSPIESFQVDEINFLQKDQAGSVNPIVVSGLELEEVEVGLAEEVSTNQLLSLQPSPSGFKRKGKKGIGITRRNTGVQRGKLGFAGEVSEVRCGKRKLEIGKKEGSFGSKRGKVVDVYLESEITNSGDVRSPIQNCKGDGSSYCSVGQVTSMAVSPAEEKALEENLSADRSSSVRRVQ
ncbi:hypothetical protein Q3G72_032070 [Acer saccharum]|nr:hypothetical protein Q3G72_032070 [Acer saccharum]